MFEKRLDQTLLDLRPQLPLLTPDESSEMEHFQNVSLRPILKFQHELILAFAQSDSILMQKLKNMPTKALFFEQVLNQLQKERSSKLRFIGLIVGLFTLDEVEFYLINEKEINKRIIGMIAQRISDTLFKA